MRIANAKSFTLMELIVAVIIVGIIATLSFHQLFNVREHIFAREAIVGLEMMIAAERMNAMEMNGTFVFCQCWSNGTAPANACNYPGPGVTGCNVSLRLKLNAQNYGFYTILPNPTTVIVVAERQDVVPAPIRDCQYRMQFVLGNPGASDAAPVPNANCPWRQ